MSKKFVFENSDLELDIADNKYYVDITDPDVVEKVLKFAKGAEEKAKELAGRDDYVEELRGTIQFCLEAIDSILGVGASDEIFEGQSVGMMSAIQVLDFIVKSINEGKKDKFSAYSPNRAQRRAK